MMNEYYIERIDGGKCNFNLWEKEGSRYFNIATLFFEDSLCGTEWSITEKSKAVNYTETEIQDEVENPLKKISVEKAQLLLKFNSAKEVAESLEDIL